MEITIVFSGYHATLSSMEPGDYVLRVPKARNSTTLLADFLNNIPDFDVSSINKEAKSHDLIHFTTDLSITRTEVVEEVVNAVSDVYNCDVSVVRIPHTPSSNYNNIP